MKILGIDPGLDGAFCVVDSLQNIDALMSTPTLDVKTGQSVKRRLDYQVAAGWFDLHRHGIDLAVIEEVTSSPQMGVTSAFAFGELFGAVRALVAAFGIPVMRVRPQVWKSHFGLLRQTKDASRAKATALAPKFAGQWAKKKDDGRAESFLLACYGLRIGQTTTS